MMSSLANLDFLRKQRDELRVLFDEAVSADDIVAEMNFQTRLEVVEHELSTIESYDSNVGEIALLFDGSPVHGQKSIDAQFATKAIKLFQDIVTRLFANGNSSTRIAARGRIPRAELAALRISGVATGSFGFVLEEREADQASAIQTQIREALEEAVEVFGELTQEDDDNFLMEVDDINPRVFNSLTQFFHHLHANDASLKATLPSKTLNLLGTQVARGYERLSATEVVIKEEIWNGQLVGLSPILRTFDFKKDGETIVSSGKFGELISQDFLERIEKGEGISLGGGARFQAAIEVATVRKPNGTISTSITATDLQTI